MKQFFKTIFILTILFVGLILYYALKNFWFRLRSQRTGNRLFGKIYEDEKAYFRNKLKTLLVNLAEGKIRWLLVYSRLFPEDRIQITYSVIDREVHLVQYSRDLKDEEQEYLRFLGVTRYHMEQGKIILSATLNSKIITDLVYFLFENIYNQGKVHNLKINISGE
jgi:hypothetical protein